MTPVTHRLLAAAALCSGLSLTSLAQFGPPVQVPQPEPFIGFWSFVPMHLNGDAFIDAFFTTDRTIGLCFGDGAGSYESPITLDSLPLNFSVQLFDMDGDTDLDIVVRYAQPDGHYFLQRLNQGDGTFAPWDTLMQAALPANESFQFLFCADINGDGLGDLIARHYVVFPSSYSWRYFINNGGFDPLSFQSIFNAGHAVHFANLDGAGTVEWLIVYGGGAQTASYDGASMVLGPALVFGLGQQFRALVDMTGDGFVDVLSGGDDDARLLVNNGAGQFPPTPIALDVIIPESCDFGDLDSDGDMDILALVVNTDHPIRWYENDGTSTAFVMHDVPPPQLTEHCFPCGQDWTDIHLADLENDGDPDVVLGGYDLYRNNGDGTFGSWEYLIEDNIPFGHGASFPMDFIDLDGDGLADRMEASSLYGWTRFRRNLGGGVFGAPVLGPRAWIGTGYDVPPYQAVDMDMDGLLDIIFHNPGRGAFAWSRNLGGFQFLDPDVTIPGPAQTRGLIGVQDFDGDGDPDVLMRGGSPTVIYAFLNNGDGTMSAELVVHPADPMLDIEDLFLEDLNSDGAAEVVFFTNNDGILWNDGSGGLSAPLLIELDPGIYPYRPFRFFDMDGDGLKDIWSTGSNTGDLWVYLTWFRNLGNNQWGPAQIACVPFQPDGSYYSNGLWVADIDGDADGDLIFHMHRDGEFEDTEVHGYAENMGGAVFGPPVVILSDWEPGYVALRPYLDAEAPWDVIYYGGPIGGGYSVWCLENTGALPYQIRGTVFVDGNGDGVRGPEETVLPFTPAAVTPLLSAVLTSPTGEYTIPAAAGSYQVAAPSSIPSQQWTLTTPSSYPVQLTQASPMARGIDFGFQPNGELTDAEVSIELGQGPCGGTMPVWITIRNRGNQISYGTMDITVNDLFGWVMSADDPAAMINGTSVSWDLGALGYYQTKTLVIVVQIPTVDFMGETLSVNATANLVDDQGAPMGVFENEKEWVLACAYDPNDKLVDPVGYGENGAIAPSTPHLDYTIRFQNTGTALAYHVLITDTLSSHLDHAHMELIASSHEVDIARVSNEGILDVRFYNILLPDSSYDFASSQGFVSFRVPLIAGAPNYTMVTNAADIFFDYNPPIHTNTVLNTLVDCALFGPVVTQPWGDMLETAPGDSHQWYLNGLPIPGATSSSLVIDQLGSYTVEVLSTYGCLATSEAFDVIMLSDSSPLSEGIRVVPNPFGDVLYVVAGAGVTSAGFIELHDVHGRLVLAERATDSRIQRIDRNGLPSGVYLLRIVQDGTVLHSARLVAE